MTVHTCTRCSRANPAEALFCYFDGTALAGQRADGPVHVGAQPFPTRFVFPTGRVCQNFDQLALACQEEADAAADALRQGDLANFLGGIGRSDLARAAREAARAPDRIRGLDAFLAALPSKVLTPPQLYVEPTAVNLGELRVGEDRKLALHLANQGRRLLYGTMACKDCVWLSFSDKAGAYQKLFQLTGETVVPLYVHGKYLAASSKPVEGRVVIESNGGEVTIVLRAAVPVRPFPEGVLAGAVSPRQIALKAKDHPREAAVFFENGAVARWYRENGWNYPVKGPTSSGLGAIQQYFEAHGLARPPKVELRQTEVMLVGRPGEQLRYYLEVRTPEDRAVYALASSNQPWLTVECPTPKGRIAPIWLTVPAVPDQPGSTLQARVVVQANGNQRFVVPVALAVSGSPMARADYTDLPLYQAVPVPVPSEPPPAAIPVGIPIAEKVNGPPRPTPPERPPVEKKQTRPRRMRHLLPAGLLLLVLLGMAVRDTLFVREEPTAVAVEDEPELIDPVPRLVLHVHDRPDAPPNNVFNHATMRFGLSTNDPQTPGATKRLTYDVSGRSNNTCIRLDGQEWLLGESHGHWQERSAPLDKNDLGRRCVWLTDDQVSITQILEIVPGQTSRLLDTCLVRYRIENHDNQPHQVGLRFLLDTFIGANDGVPFTLPGSTELCDTAADFNSPGAVPDFIQALEHDDLAHPGTVANLQLRLGGRIEAPERVTLGAWPNGEIRRNWNGSRFGRGRNGPRVREQVRPEIRDLLRSERTLWDVPVLPIRILQMLRPGAEADSAVVMYWPERELPPGGSREVGFAYGLGNVTSSAGGKLALTVGGSLVRGEDFSVTAYVTRPAPGQRLTLQLPPGLRLQDSAAAQPVPPVPADAPRPISTVTWKVHAAAAGPHVLTVVSSTGAEQSQKISVRQRSIFD